jgi:putative heme d1 biosynthesis radical SAM protein NirJ2
MIISWNTTKVCNLKCEHCYRDAGGRDPQELNTAEGIALIDEIALAGFKILILSGGEPLMREDIFELVEHSVARGLRPVMGTNGTLFTRDLVCKMKAAGVARAGISLDSNDKSVHDAFRKMDGAWDSAVNGMKLCREEGLSFQVHTTVTKRNMGEITSMTDFVAGLGAAAHHIFFLVPTGRGKDISGVFLNAKDIKAVLKAVLNKQKDTPIELKPVCAPQFMPMAKSMGLSLRFSRGCLAGTGYCCILPNGDVHPCPYLPMKAGNVRQKPFSGIWKESDIFTRLRTLSYSGSCGVCGSKELCGGCRARAYAEFGDYMAEDPGCPITHP